MKTHRLGKWAEIAWPWILSAAVAAIAASLNKRLILPIDPRLRIIDKLAEFCSIGIGFWATALAILLALEGRQTIAGLKTLEIYERIVGYFLGTVYAFFALLILCLATLALGRPTWFPLPIFAAIWGFLPAFTAFSMIRSFRLLGKLLRAE